MATKRPKKKAVRKGSTISVDKQRYRKMETALKVIHTWTSKAIESDSPYLLVTHEDVIELIDKALGRK